MLARSRLPLACAGRGFSPPGGSGRGHLPGPWDTPPSHPVTWIQPRPPPHTHLSHFPTFPKLQSGFHIAVLLTRFADSIFL